MNVGCRKNPIIYIVNKYEIMCNCHIRMDIRGRCHVGYVDIDDWKNCRAKLDTIEFLIFNESEYHDMFGNVGIKRTFANPHFKKTIINKYHINDKEYKKLEENCDEQYHENSPTYCYKDITFIATCNGTKWKCPCGSVICKSSIRKHIKSKNHVANYKDEKEDYYITDIGLTMLKEVGLNISDVIDYEYNPYIDDNTETSFNHQILMIRRDKTTIPKIEKFKKTCTNCGSNDDVYITTDWIKTSTDDYSLLISKTIHSPFINKV